ncbi:unnamed protein product [Chrysodeixis includens]|uniref:Peptidase S1 domain-containing protein n=1 Tax=Chrysodeixis includens TaxID=689277 RepID=A0A9N8L0I6_CHRIL|nr:unnamed protein product [Chrysodeixis includens]
MRALLLFGFALVVSASAVEVPATYHDTIGIPLAAEIKASEEAYLKSLPANERIIGGAIAPVNAHPYFQVHRNVFLFPASIAPINLPQNNELWQSFEGQLATAAGFGKTSDQQSGSSTIVSHVNLRVMNLARCQQIYNNPMTGVNFVVASTLCTDGWGGVGICGGDSGGPLVANVNGRNILIGVSSFAADNACQQSHPSGFARVTSFMNFINQHM